MASPILSVGLQYALLKAINEQYKNRWWLEVSSGIVICRQWNEYDDVA